MPADRSAPTRPPAETPVSVLAGRVRGPKGDAVAFLGKLGIETVEGLLRHYPRDHEDRREPRPLASLRPGENAVVRGTVTRKGFQTLYGRRGNRAPCVLRATLTDDSGSIRMEIWNRNWVNRWIHEGEILRVSGKVSERRGLRLIPTEWAVEDGEGLRGEDALSWDRIAPVYPTVKSLRQKDLRTLLVLAAREWAGRVEEFLPPEILRARSLVPAKEGIRGIHDPRGPGDLADAQRRLRYEELLLLQITVHLTRRELRRERRGFRYSLGPVLDERIRARFPFALTPAQDRVVGEILADLAAPHPMNRLLQGDVGSGKTAVALYAALAVVANRRQAAVLAPTEILAEQHHEGFRRALEGSRVRIELLSGGLRAKARREILAATAAGEVDILVATHAVLEEDVVFRDLGLAVVDEQHRFGVRQRRVFLEKGLHPDLLYMTATPIPRTLRMSRTGHLDVSILEGKPPGRRPVTTLLFRTGEEAEAHDLVRREVAAGRQAFFICPLVNEDPDGPGGGPDRKGKGRKRKAAAGPRRRRSSDRELRAAVKEAERLQSEVYPDLRVGLLHGRLKAEEKRAVMEDFRAGRLHVLVSTVVVEVGVDVPNASVLAVLHAERFGLSQLHQLRGRIGRGPHPSHCVLLADPRSPEAEARLEAMLETDDGFVIAERDLAIRGPGDMLGTRQAGAANGMLLAGLLDHALHALAREDARDLLERDPRLERPGHRALKGALEARYGERAELLRV